MKRNEIFREPSEVTCAMSTRNRRDPSRFASSSLSKARGGFKECSFHRPRFSQSFRMISREKEKEERIFPIYLSSFSPSTREGKSHGGHPRSPYESHRGSTKEGAEAWRLTLAERRAIGDSVPSNGEKKLRTKYSYSG